MTSLPPARDAAESALDRAQTLQPDWPETLLALGHYQYLGAGDYRLAKTTFPTRSGKLPGNSDVLMGLGGISGREGHWDQSIAYWEQALAVDPRNEQLLSRAAWTYGYHQNSGCTKAP